MKIIDAITRIDSLIFNTYTQQDKIGWLSDVDWDVVRNVMKCKHTEFQGYGSDTDLQTELLIPAPYDKAYLLWMEAQIHYYNAEYDRYNNAIVMFNKQFSEFAAFWNREHRTGIFGKRFRF